MSRRKFLKKSSCAAFGILTLPAYHSAFSSNPKTDDLIIGHGDFRYKVDLNWGNLNPLQTPVKDCHEMVQDGQGRIVLLTNHPKNNVIIYDKSGKLLETWGTEYPGAHGLTLVNENGEDFLFITDYERHQVVKTTLTGQVVLTIDYPKETGFYTSADEFKPTETTVLPNGDFYIADGYGNQYISHYNHKGELQSVFGGRGTGEGQFLNAHGICYDYRAANAPCLLVSARSQNKLKRFDLDGTFLSSIDVPGALICRPVVHKEQLYFAVLQSAKAPNSDSGFILIMDAQYKVVSCPGATAPNYDNTQLDELYQTIRLFQHPHDVCIDDDDNMYVAQWNSGQSYPIKLIRV